mgnify:FL=1
METFGVKFTETWKNIIQSSKKYDRHFPEFSVSRIRFMTRPGWADGPLALADTIQHPPGPRVAVEGYFTPQYRLSGRAGLLPQLSTEPYFTCLRLC